MPGVLLYPLFVHPSQSETQKIEVYQEPVLPQIVLDLLVDGPRVIAVRSVDRRRHNILLVSQY